MFNQLIKIFKSDDEQEQTNFLNDQSKAVACLLIEAAGMDGSVDMTETETIKSILSNQFDLSSTEADNLMAEAHKHVTTSNQILPMTRVIKETYDEAEKIKIIEMIWEVILSDGILHAYEDNLMRRIGALIYVSDRDRGAAKKRVMERLGLDDNLETQV